MNRHLNLLAALLIWGSGVTLSALDIEPDQFKPVSGKAEIRTEEDGKLLHLEAGPKDKETAIGATLKLKPFHKYQLTLEFRASEVKDTSKQWVRGTGITLKNRAKILFRGSHLGRWKHAKGAFSWKTITVPFRTWEEEQTVLICEISGASGTADFRRIRIEDQTPVRKAVRNTGCVFRDDNGNGRRDPGEPGLPDIQVSDGLTIVKTDAQGNYVLPKADGRFIFATKPKDGIFTTPYYRPLSEKTDFGIRPCPVKKKTVFLSVNDSECKDASGFIGEVAAAAKQYQADFLVHCGDIGNQPGHKKTMTGAGIPVYYAIGNHDFKRNKNGGEAFFEQNFGPLYFSFDYGNVHFIVVSYFYGVDFPPTADLEERQYQWFKEDLRLNPGPVVVFRHHPIRVFPDPLAKLMLDRKVKISAMISGHTHATQARLVAGIVTAECAPPEKGAVDHTPRGFLKGTYDENGLDIAVINPVRYRPGPVADPASEPVILKGDWPQFRRTADRDGMAAAPLGLPLKLRWKTKTPGLIYASSPIIVKDLIVIASLDDTMAKNGTVSAYVAATGKLRWKTVVGPSVKHTLASDGKRIYGAAVDGLAFALDIDTGKILWRNQVSDYFGIDGLYAPCTLLGNRLWIGGNRLTELNPANGKIVRRDDKYNTGAPCHAGALIADGTIFTCQNWRQGIFANDLKTGKRKWVVKREKCYAYLDSGPVFYQGRLYQKILGGIRMLDPATGKCLAEYRYTPARDGRYKESFSLPAAADGRIYSGSAYGMFAHDAKDLKLLWSFEPRPEMLESIPYADKKLPAVHSSPALAPGQLIFGGGDGFLYILDLATGKKLTEIDLGATVFSSPAVSGNTLAVAAADGTLYIFTGKALK